MGRRPDPTDFSKQWWTGCLFFQYCLLTDWDTADHARVEIIHFHLCLLFIYHLELFSRFCSVSDINHVTCNQEFLAFVCGHYKLRKFKNIHKTGFYFIKLESSTVVRTKSDSDLIYYLHLLSKTLSCTFHLS